MTTLLIATRNAHKVGEIQVIFGAQFHFLTLNDFPAAPKVVEDADTFERRWMVTVRLGDGGWRVTNYQEFEG